ncbi:MAG TPA: MFS transporter, partial [Woeseiaceae bacterium]|nr:MFS transporter [Woeseiaceae bacterium]
ASRRSLILGLVGSASSLGAIVAAPVGQALNSGYGDWRIGMIGFIVLALSIIPAAWFAGRVDRQTLSFSPSGSDDLSGFAAMKVALCHGPFLVMSTAFFVCGMQLVFLLTHLPNYLAICGMDPMLGATALGIIGAFNVAGSIFFGWAGGRWPKQALLGIIYLCRSAILTWFFMTPPTPESVILFAGLMGFFWLGVSPLIAGSVIEMFGLRWQPMIQGITFFVHQFGSFAGAFGGGYAFDAMGSYDLAWRVGVIVGATAGAVQLAVGLWRPPATPRLRPA